MTEPKPLLTDSSPRLGTSARSATRPPDEERNSAMTMGYVIEINQTATDYPCPLCGKWESARLGLVIVQRPSGDVVCEGCAEHQLEALHSDLNVLRQDTPTDFPEVWPDLARLLAIDRAADPELGLLLEIVALQRFTGPGHEDRYRPEHPSIGSALGTIARPTSASLYNDPAGSR
jgi:predicted RNA-binding Zn-ribbon protein involved in translation (DUF1610 family)